ncbi:MAG: PAS domain-containing protein [Roseobacter sp.]
MIDVKALSADFTDGRMDKAAELFKNFGKGCPTVVWHPSDFDFNHPTIQSFSRSVRSIGASDQGVPLAQFNELNLESYSPWMMRLRVVPGENDFEYLQYGERITNSYGRDLTGCRTSSFEGYVRIFFQALYCAAVERQQWVLSRHQPPSTVFVHFWNRLIIPLIDESGSVIELAALNVPENELRTGFQALPDPILVLNREGRILFSNTAAEKLFGAKEFASNDIHVPEYCGFEYSLPAIEKNPVLQHKAYFEEKISHDKQLIVHFDVTSSVAYYRDDFYFIVTVKPQ